MGSILDCFKRKEKIEVITPEEHEELIRQAFSYSYLNDRIRRTDTNLRYYNTIR